MKTRKENEIKHREARGSSMYPINVHIPRDAKRLSCDVRKIVPRILGQWEFMELGWERERVTQYPEKYQPQHREQVKADYKAQSEQKELIKEGIESLTEGVITMSGEEFPYSTIGNLGVVLKFGFDFRNYVRSFHGSCVDKYQEEHIRRRAQEIKQEFSREINDCKAFRLNVRVKKAFLFPSMRKSFRLSVFPVGLYNLAFHVMRYGLRGRNQQT